jgi:hypothetical protein
MPRMDTSQRTGIISPAEGLQVYDTDTKQFGIIMVWSGLTQYRIIYPVHKYL